MRLPLVAALIIALTGCAQKAKEKPKEPPRLPVIKYFYGNAATVAKGESLTLCYGTENVDRLTMEPYDDGDLPPSFNRCIAHTPTKDTTYVLKASGPGGETSATFSVRIGAAAPRERTLIHSFNSVGNVPVSPGGHIQLCYTTNEAVSLTMEPSVANILRPGRNRCVAITPRDTATYILTATAADGFVDRMQVTVPVQ